MTKAILIPYLSIGLLMAFVMFLVSGKRQARFTDFAVDRINRSVQLRDLSRSWPRWIGFQTIRVISSLIVIITWPVLTRSFVQGFISGFTGSQAVSYRETNANARLASAHIAASVTVTLFAAVVLLLRIRSHPDWIIDLSCYLVLASFVTRLAYNFLRKTDLPSQLKQNLLHPYVQFGMVAVVDYAALMFAALTLDWNAGDRLTIPVLVNQARDIAAFSHVTQIFRNVPHTLDAVMITLGAVTFAVMIVGQATKFKQFKRTPKDHAQIIVDLMTAGRRSAALTRLRRLSDAERADSDMVLPRTLAAISEGKCERAYQLTEADFISNAESKSLKYLTRTPDDICTQLLLLTFLIGKFAPEEYRSVIQYSIARGISDGCLFTVLIDVGDFPVFETPDDLAAAGITADTYPLSHAACTALLFGPEDGTAETVLVSLTAAISALAPATPTDQIVRDALLIVYRLRLGVLDEAVLGRLLDLVETMESLPGWLARQCCLSFMQIDRAIPTGDPLLARVNTQVGRIVANASEAEAQRFRSAGEAAHATFLEHAGPIPPRAIEADLA